jgi:hypothetical protein
MEFLPVLPFSQGRIFCPYPTWNTHPDTSPRLGAQKSFD